MRRLSELHERDQRCAVKKASALSQGRFSSGYGAFYLPARVSVAGKFLSVTVGPTEPDEADTEATTKDEPSDP
jgi:hypothetical protein